MRVSSLKLPDCHLGPPVPLLIRYRRLFVGGYSGRDLKLASPLSSPEIKNYSSYAPTAHYPFMAFAGTTVPLSSLLLTVMTAQ
jgi:hypothetical protein